FSSTTWLSGAAFLATSDSYHWDIAEGTHNMVIDAYTKELGYFGGFPQSDMLGGDKLYAISHGAGNVDVMRALSAGRSFVIYSGHGWTGGWVGPDMNSSDVLSLTNPDNLPFVVGFACDTADYRGEGGIAEAWQRHPNGAVVYWGSYNSSYWDEDDILQQ